LNKLVLLNVLFQKSWASLEGLEGMGFYPQKKSVKMAHFFGVSNQ